MKNFLNLKAGAVIALLFIFSGQVYGQGFAPSNGFKQVNFGIEFDGYGLPVYAGLDYGVADMITIGPQIMFATESNTIVGNDHNWTIILPSFRGDYHFSGHINELPAALDLYGGLSLGLAIFHHKYEYYDELGNKRKGDISDSDVELWLQLGARYYFSPKWGVQLEFASYGTNGSIGMSYKL